MDLEAESEQKQYKVLIAEDSQLQRLALVDFLLVNNYIGMNYLNKVTEAQNGQAAMDMIKERGGDFDIILLDYNMPLVVDIFY